MVDRADPRDLLGAVAEQQLLLGRGAALAPVGEVLEENREPRLRLGVRARPVQVRERRMGQELDRTVSSSSSRDAPRARERPTR